MGSSLLSRLFSPDLLRLDAIKKLRRENNCMNPLNITKKSLYSRCLDSRKVLGSAFGESISHKIVRKAMVMHEVADWCYTGEQVLGLR